MAKFRLPANSRYTKGKTHESPTKGRLRRFRIYRYDPDSGDNPRVDTYQVDLDSCSAAGRTMSSTGGVGARSRIRRLTPCLPGPLCCLLAGRSDDLGGRDRRSGATLG